MDQQLLSIIITITATTAAAAAINRHNYLIDVIEEGKLGSQVESQLAGWSCHPEKKYRQKVVDVADWTELQKGGGVQGDQVPSIRRNGKRKEQTSARIFPVLFLHFSVNPLVPSVTGKMPADETP